MRARRHERPSARAARRRVAIAVAALACAAGTDYVARANGPIVVSQQGRAFGVKELKVAVGTVVRILNDDEFTHHAFIDSPALKFDSGEISRGQWADIELKTAGSFTVRCAIHPKMRLAIEAK